MLIKADKIITLYGKTYFDVLYNDTNKVEYCHKSLLIRSDFTCEMALKLPINKTQLFLDAYRNKNNSLMKKLLPDNQNDDNPPRKLARQSYYCSINHACLFNEAMLNDDVELLKISNRIHKLPNQFIVDYNDYDTSGYGDVKSTSTTSRRHCLLNLVKHLQAEKCYTYMVSNLGLFIVKCTHL